MKRLLSCFLLLALCAALLSSCYIVTYSEGEVNPQELIDQITPYVHISFDDVEKVFANLKANNYTSIWEEPFLAALREAHFSYGARFSLYVWKDVLHDQPTKYQKEWQDAYYWLKIGLHSDADGNFAEADYERGKTEWEHFVADVYAMTGSYECIDYIPRLHNFAGSAEALRGMSEAEHGALGFLAADDERISYDLTAEENAALRESDLSILHGRMYLPTDLRFENHRDKSMYEVLYEKWGDEPDEKFFILFTHEYELYDGIEVNENFTWIDEAALYFSEQGIPFGYTPPLSFSPRIEK